MNKIILKYGTLAGIVMTIYLYLTYSSGFIYRSEKHAYIAYLTILILPICIFLALKELKNTGAAPSLKNSILSGLYIAFVCAAVYSFYVWVNSHFFNMSANQKMFEHLEYKMLAEGKSTADIQASIEKYRAHYLSWKPITGTFLSMLPLGAFYALIFHFLLHKKTKKNNT